MQPLWGLSCGNTEGLFYTACVQVEQLHFIKVHVPAWPELKCTICTTSHSPPQVDPTRGSCITTISPLNEQNIKSILIWEANTVK